MKHEQTNHDSLAAGHLGLQHNGDLDLDLELAALAHCPCLAPSIFLGSQRIAMRLLIPILSVVFASVVTQATATDPEASALAGAVHLPIQRQSGAQMVRKRGGVSTAVAGVGDNMDV